MAMTSNGAMHHPIPNFGNTAATQAGVPGPSVPRPPQIGGRTDPKPATIDAAHAQGQSYAREPVATSVVAEGAAAGRAQRPAGNGEAMGANRGY